MRAQEASRTPQTHEAIREELERLRKQESRRAHEITRERLNQALGRAERDEVEREEDRTHKHREHGHGHGHKNDGHGWGL